MPGLDRHQSAEPVAEHEYGPQAYGAAQREQRDTEPADGVAVHDPGLLAVAPGRQKSIGRLITAKTAITQRFSRASRTAGLKLPPVARLGQTGCGDMKATVLHRVATANGRFTRSEIETAIRFLLDRGADPAIRDEVYHSTPIGWAWHFGQRDSVDVLIDRGGIHDAVGCDRPDRVRMLLTHDPGLANASDEEGRTPLHRLHGALTHGSEMIDLLVQYHADVNARDRRGVTVLAKITASGAADLADRLRSLGAN